MGIFENFEKKHDYLICVDSDGCVMDTMNCKHFNCFGPCMVTEWGLEEWKDAILARWNEINLFEKGEALAAATTAKLVEILSDETIWQMKV